VPHDRAAARERHVTERDALLAAIRARPADDTARLVFADWLDEHGEPQRAEFVRLQIEAARLAPHDPRVREIEDRTALLIGHRRKEWEGPVRDLLPGARLEFRRGFVDSVVTDAALFLRHTAELRTAAPLSRIELRKCGDVICSVNLSARETQARLYAVANPGAYGYRTTIALLPQAPAELEPELQTGAWFVLAWAVWSGADRTAVHRMHDTLRDAHQSFNVRFAMRPYASRDEFETWFPGAPEFVSPVWVRLENGKPVDHSTGLVPPVPLRAVWG
jgi:uncharacterized protein (TIGR02996 family)